MIKKLFIEKTDAVYIQFIRYSIVGICMSILDMAILYALTEYGHVYYLNSAKISFIITVIIHFILSSRWAFQSDNKNRYWINMIGFIVIGVVGFYLSIFLLEFFTEKINIYYMLSKIITIAIVYVFNFTARKLILFKRIAVTENL